MWFTLKQLLRDSTDFTEAIFKMPQISKHFSAMPIKRVKIAHSFLQFVSDQFRVIICPLGLQLSARFGN